MTKKSGGYESCCGDMVNIASVHMPLVRASGVANPIINVTYVYSSTGGTACLMKK